MDKIPVEDKKVMNVTVINKQKPEGAFVDVFTVAVTVVIFVAIIASYFVMIDPTAKISVQEITVEVVWILAGTVSIGELIKQYNRTRGRRTESYKAAEEEAREKMKALCESPYRNRVSDYCKNYTDSTITLYREHQLHIVGISMEEYSAKYLGKGLRELWGCIKKKEISMEQYRAIRRCNKIKIKAYDPNFITSFNASFSLDKTPSQMFDADRANKINMVKSLVLSFVSAVFVGRLFTNIVLNFTAAAVFSSIIKVVMILINAAFKASFGWNLAQMEIQRNKLRASETEACIDWCKNNSEKQLVEKIEEFKPLQFVNGKVELQK